MCDRQADGQNYDSQDCASIATVCSRSKNAFSPTNSLKQQFVVFTVVEAYHCTVYYTYEVLLPSLVKSYKTVSPYIHCVPIEARP